MSDIHITRPHRFAAKKSRAVAEQIAADLQEKFELQYEWDEDGVLHFHRTGVRGQLTLEKNAIDLRLKLNLLMSPLRPLIEREINAFLDERFAAPKA